MNKKIISIILLVVGVVLLVWGYNTSQSVSGQFSQVFSGSPSDKALILYIVGGICAAIGVFNLVKN